MNAGRLASVTDGEGLIPPAVIAKLGTGTRRSLTLLRGLQPAHPAKHRALNGIAGRPARTQATLRQRRLIREFEERQNPGA